MPLQAEKYDSVESLKSKIIHGNGLRYKRAIIAIFVAQLLIMIPAWYLLEITSISFTIPAAPLKLLLISAFVVNLCSLSIVFLKKKLYLATSIMSIFYSILFIPTLLLTGGFISPFSVVYLLIMLLSVVMVDVIPPLIGNISSIIIIIGYVGVSLVQKAGFSPVEIVYVQTLLEQKYFFWLIFTIVTSCFINGFLATRASSKNVRDTLTQLILTYRYVAKGTSLFISENFIPDLLKSLVKALQVRTVFLIEWTNERVYSQSTGSQGRVKIASRNSIDESDVLISEEFKMVVAKAIFENNHSLQALNMQMNSYVSLEFAPLFDYWSPIYDSTGDIVGVLGAADRSRNSSQEVLVEDIMHIFSSRISAEISRRIEEKKRLKMQNLMAQGQKMQAIGQLTSCIAHDFNNILNGIFGFASLISRNTEKDSGLNKYSAKIIQLGKSAAGLISQLLVYSRHVDVSSSTVVLNQVIEECVDIIKHTTKKRIQINVELPEYIVKIDGDVPMIQSAILNLFINACDAIENEGVLSIALCRIHLEDNTNIEFISGKKIPAGEFAQLTVSDTGSGISEDELIRIFEPFYTSKKVGYGTGLGLSAVFGCMESHNGFIAVDSVVEKGSTFRLFFQMKTIEDNSKVENSIIKMYVKDNNEIESINKESINKESINKESINKESINKESFDNPLIVRESVETDIDVSKSSIDNKTVAERIQNKKTIMIVDDEESILESLFEYLTGMNYKVIVCDSGTVALDKYATQNTEIDAILLDMVLPDIGGREVFEQMYKINSDLKVIIMTGYSTLEDLDHVKMLGAKKIFYKPFDYNNLDTILHEIIRG